MVCKSDYVASASIWQPLVAKLKAVFAVRCFYKYQLCKCRLHNYRMSLRISNFISNLFRIRFNLAATGCQIENCLCGSIVSSQALFASASCKIAVNYVFFCKDKKFLFSLKKFLTFISHPYFARLNLF